MLADFLSAAYTELSYGVPQIFAVAVACEQRAPLRAAARKSRPVHVAAMCRRRRGPILRLIGPKCVWACLLLVRFCVWVLLRAGRDRKCVACLPHADLLTN